MLMASPNLGRKRKTACSGERPTCETCLQNRLDCAGYAPDAPAPGNKRSNSDTNVEIDLPNGNSHAASNKPRQGSRSNHAEQEQQLHSGLRRGSTQSMGPPGQGNRSGHDVASANNVPPSQSAHGHRQPTTEDAVMEETKKDSLFSGPRNRMPYFRWLGPTAVVPGFKQMVVQIKRQESDIGRSSNDSVTAAGSMVSPSVTSHTGTSGGRRLSTIYTAMSANVDNESRSPLSLPFYDTSQNPPSELTTHLANTFFTHLGCNYPFLQRERFMRDLEEKQVDAILVDAVCALAARFSTHSLLVQQTNDNCPTAPADYGHEFAQRAQTALVDCFACPTVAAVQAALLLAYNEFGENRDSGLWMYLGISIRMAQDLGLHKVEGLKYKGMDGPTPKLLKKENMGGSPGLTAKRSSSREEDDDEESSTSRDKMARKAGEALIDAKDHVEVEEEREIGDQMAVEQGRVDTFWVLYFLDRVVSSGTGRTSTIRDNDIELSFPSLEETDPRSGWPAPYPALIRIIHLYGRVADLLNGIKEPSDITSETPRRLASMERQVTNFYQGLSPRLHFDAFNFQHYVKAGEGTNFVLLHFWFHTLIVLLHQPTLLKTFEGRMLQLFPNSHQLAMSSAKTIADILSYSQLMDAKASLGNPFTTQPIYIAACAFLRETVEQTTTSRNHSRNSSPTRSPENKDDSDDRPTTSSKHRRKARRKPTSQLSSSSSHRSTSADRHSNSSVDGEKHVSSERSGHSGMSGQRTANALAKHTLLATAASQHYQLCYKSLEAVNTYWAGTKYMLTVLDQKVKGVRDPLLYTAEEGESAMEKPRPEPAFTSPGWRRKMSWAPIIGGPNLPQRPEFWRDRAPHIVGGSPADMSKAIGWALTGTMNSPSTNLAWHYPSAANSSSPQQEHPKQQSRPSPESPVINHSMPTGASFQMSTSHAPSDPVRTTSAQRAFVTQPHTSSAALAISTSGGATYMSGMEAQFSDSGDSAEHQRHAFAVRPVVTNDMSTVRHHQLQNHTFSRPGSSHDGQDTLSAWNYDSLWQSEHNAAQPFGDMMIESQDIDMNMLGLDMMPWFDAAHEYSEFFDSGNHQSPLTPGTGRGGGHSGSGRRAAH